MKIEHILTATDFSEASLPALTIAGQWAKAYGARLSIVHAFDPMPLGAAANYPSTNVAAAANAVELSELANRELDRACEGRFEGVEVTRELIQQPAAWLGIRDYAEDHDVDLIVLGTHGRTGVERLLIGSTAERVTRHAHCPVLVVRGAAPESSFPRHVLVATDFSPQSERAFEPARELAVRCGAKLTVGHVYDSSPIMLGEHPAFTDAAALDAELKRKLRAVMEERFAGVAGVRTALLAAASPVVGLADYAREENVDLIVIATHGRSGLARVLMGSVAERIVRHASCSVLIVRRGETE